MSRARVESNQRQDAKEFTQAFGDRFTGIGYNIYGIKRNSPNVTVFQLYQEDASKFSDRAWELLGRYIANNNHLERLVIGYDSGIYIRTDTHVLTDDMMCHLFRELVKSDSLKSLYLSRNSLGIDSIRSMVPFLGNSQTLSELDLSSNTNITAEAFEVLINALDGKCIKELKLDRCSIDNISALGNRTLPHLRTLHLIHNNISGGVSALENHTKLCTLSLQHNNIGREGCLAIANLLQKEDSMLKELNLDANDIDDEGAEILATSLKRNDTLYDLRLDGNKLGKRGCLAFLKLLCDVSSIENTCYSNHTLTRLSLPFYSNDDDVYGNIVQALNLNMDGHWHNPSRKKVIKFQLNSNVRMTLCHLQGIEYSYNGIFSEIDALVLPELLALVGQNHGQSEMYRLLIAVVSDLASTVNREAVLKDRMDENTAQIAVLKTEYERKLAEYELKVAALTAENASKTALLTEKNLKLQRELEAIQSVQKSQLCGKKRDRCEK